MVRFLFVSETIYLANHRAGRNGVGFLLDNTHGAAWLVGMVVA
jgi:hypothetical protein